MKRIIPIILLLTVAIVGGYWWFTRPTVAALEPATLTGSGTIEAETIAITAELGGRIIELKVDEGAEVRAGQILVELDKTDLLAQQAQLAAALATAQANLELVNAPARPQAVAAAQAQLSQAQVAWEGARLTWQRARALANDPNELRAQITQARARVTGAERKLELARVNLKRAEIQAEAAARDQSDHAALAQNEAAQYQLQAARIGVEMAEVALAGAEKQVEHLIRLREKPLPLIAQANAAAAAAQQAEAAILVAQANLAAVKAGPAPEDIAIAQAQALEAEAALAAVEVQLAKQTLTAPRNGLVSQNLVNPGELAAPGAVLLELNDIETVELTVYIPETRIGQVKMGQTARVYVDAYPGEAFAGTVSFIAHQAEFTPRNVQTPEERVNLVFAVKIRLDNAGHRLKPGMPAEAEILLESRPGAVKLPSPAASPGATAAPATTPTPARVEATPTVAPTLTPTPAAAAPSVRAEVIAWGLNVRRGPGVDYPVIATLRQGATVPVVNVDPNSGWLQVRLPAGGETGWISGSPTYVRLK